MRKHAETFYTNKGYKFSIVFLIPTSSVFKIESCGIFPMLFGLKRGLLHPTFYKKMNHFLIVFNMKWDKWQRFNALRSGFWNGFVFRESALSQVQSQVLGPVYRFLPFQYCKINDIVKHSWRNINVDTFIDLFQDFKPNFSLGSSFPIGFWILEVQIPGLDPVFIECRIY